MFCFVFTWQRWVSKNSYCERIPRTSVVASYHSGIVKVQERYSGESHNLTRKKNKITFSITCTTFGFRKLQLDPEDPTPNPVLV